MADRQIRVLHVIGAMNRAGAETFIMNVYRAINREEIQFDFLVHTDEQCDYDAEIEELGGRIFHVEKYNVLNRSKYKRQIRQFFQDHHDYACVHGHIGSSASIYLSEAKKAGLFTVAHSHSNIANERPSLQTLAYKALTHSNRNVADYFMACSEESGRDRYGDAVVQSESFAVINNGIHVNDYACTAKDNLQAKLFLGFNDVPVFGHVGRLAPVKNHAFLLNIFKYIHKELPNAKLVLAGGGELEETLKKQANNLGLSQDVLFLGVRNDIPHILQAFDVFVFPSCYEGLGIAVIEAQASGLPCIVSTGLPKDVEITDHIERVNLDLGAEKWAELCIGTYKQRRQRHDSIEEVTKAGFNITETAQFLSNFYKEHSRH